ncbi:MAG: hypothetical protein JWM37_102 [Candidatus Saccharibacteria bacterium]|nr:hypothetical protein [Candidatus Saccharibacteria bacterium]
MTMTDGSVFQVLADAPAPTDTNNPFYVFFLKLLDWLFYPVDLIRFEGHPWWGLILLILELLLLSLVMGGGGILGLIVGRTRTRNRISSGE